MTEMPVLTAVIGPEHVDYNGHMTEGAYGLLFGRAAALVLERLDLGAAYRTRSGSTMYTLESRTRYLAEAHPGEEVQIHHRLLDADGKRLHIYMTMKNADGRLLACYECVSLHVAQDRKGGPGAAPFPPEHMAQIKAVLSGPQSFPEPAGIGQAMGLRRKASASQPPRAQQK